MRMRYLKLVQKEELKRMWLLIMFQKEIRAKPLMLTRYLQKAIQQKRLRTSSFEDSIQEIAPILPHLTSVSYLSSSLTARVFLTLSLSLPIPSYILSFSGWSFKLHLVSTQNWCNFLVVSNHWHRPTERRHLWFCLYFSCSAPHVWMVFEMGGKWPYSLLFCWGAASKIYSKQHVAFSSSSSQVFFLLCILWAFFTILKISWMKFIIWNSCW